MNQSFFKKYPTLKYIFYLVPLLGSFIAWKVSGVPEIGIFMLVGVSIINVVFYLRNRNKK
jgi:hypothetical protein